jgi:hypothetical protein
VNDTLVAPIFTSDTNITARSVWIPPGDWIDGWSGETVSGPKTINVSQPFERIPMWHRKGGMLVTTDAPGVRIDDQDWATLTLESWPDVSSAPSTTATSKPADEPTALVKTVDRFVFSQQGKGARGARTKISMKTVPKADITGGKAGGGKIAGTVHFAISRADDGSSRAWAVRMHLAPGQRAVSAFIDGHALAIDPGTEHSGSPALRHLEPLSHPVAHTYFPFAGASSRPASLAGAVAEVVIEASTQERAIEVTVIDFN